MGNDKVKFISFNVNGLLNPIKRSNILTKMKKEQPHIVYLQETHLNDKEHEKLKEWVLLMYFSPHTNQDTEEELLFSSQAS